VSKIAAYIVASVSKIAAYMIASVSKIAAYIVAPVPKNSSFSGLSGETLAAPLGSRHKIKGHALPPLLTWGLSRDSFGNKERNTYNIVVKKSFRAVEVIGAGSHEEATSVDENHDRKQFVRGGRFRNVDIEDKAVLNADDRVGGEQVVLQLINWGSII
jgi:hypothetical protein